MVFIIFFNVPSYYLNKIEIILNIIFHKMWNQIRFSKHRMYLLRLLKHVVQEMLEIHVLRH